MNESRKFKKRREVYLSITQFNEILRYAKKTKNVLFREHISGVDSMIGCAYLDLRQVYARLTMNSLEDGKPVTYVTRMDGSKVIQETSGMQAYSIMQRYYRCKDFTSDATVCELLGYIDEIERFSYGASAFLYANSRFVGKRVEAWDYDVNSSYSWALTQKMPFTEGKMSMYREVSEGKEIGFKRIGTDLEVALSGKAEFIFKLVKSPYLKFVSKYYSKKKNARKNHDVRKAEKAKQTMNYAVGYLQRKNPFMRSAILYYANKKIKDLVDEDTIFCSTDSIVSARKRDDIPIGTDIGQFKIEKHGHFAFVNFNYQWDDEVAHMRGVPSAWIAEYIKENGRYDILEGKPIPPRNRWVFDINSFQLIRRKD